MRAVFWVSAGVFVALLITIISMGLFDGITFFGLVFYVALYFGGYYYIKNGFDKRQEEADDMKNRKNKFEYCWSRVNLILKRMPGGQGLQWSQGVGRKSQWTTFYDGVQNKPFRSMMAHLENSQQIVLVIFDIEGDDIASFITNPQQEYYENPFYKFKPYSKGMSSEMGMMRNPYKQYNSVARRRGAVSINIDDGSDSFEEMSARLKPEKDTVDKALDKLR